MHHNVFLVFSVFNNKLMDLGNKIFQCDLTIRCRNNLKIGCVMKHATTNGYICHLDLVYRAKSCSRFAIVSGIVYQSITMLTPQEIYQRKETLIPKNTALVSAVLLWPFDDVMHTAGHYVCIFGQEVATSLFMNRHIKICINHSVTFNVYDVSSNKQKG